MYMQNHNPMGALVPMVLENEGTRSERSFDIYSLLLKHRCIFINSMIEQKLTSVVVAQLLYLAAESNKDINLYINSGGGVVTDGLEIISTIKYLAGEKVNGEYTGVKVNSIVTGQACSMASLISTACTGKRSMLEYSRNMIHTVRGGFSGAIHDAERDFEEMTRLNTLLTGIYVENNSKEKTFEDFQVAMSRDKFFTPTEAVEFGLVDEVLISKK